MKHDWVGQAAEVRGDQCREEAIREQSLAAFYTSYYILLSPRGIASSRGEAAVANWMK